MKSKKKKESHSPEIVMDQDNVRIHDSRNREAIRKSLELGAGRSIFVDSENVIIGGNGVFQEAREMGFPVRVIDSDGSELIAIRRTDLKTRDAKRKALAIADNRTNDLSAFDDAKVAAIFQDLEDFAANTGFTDKEIAELMAAQDAASENIEQFGDEKPEIEFSEELLECHNYVVLFFDNEVDWLQIQTLLGLQTVKDSSSKPGYIRTGTGRVIRGAEALNKILGAAQ